MAKHITFTSIASTDTTFPSDPDSHFLGFGTFPAVDKKGDVAFKGFDANDQAIFVGDGDSLQFVVDLNTALPGNPGPIVSLADPTIGDGVVAFTPNGGVNGRLGVYEWDAGSIKVIVDHSTVLPDGSHVTGSGDTPAIDEQGNVAFFGGQRDPGESGVFKFVNGELTEVMGGIPTSGPGPSISHGHVAYIDGAHQLRWKPCCRWCARWWDVHCNWSRAGYQRKRYRVSCIDIERRRWRVRRQHALWPCDPGCRHPRSAT